MTSTEQETGTSAPPAYEPPCALKDLGGHQLGSYTRGQPGPLFVFIGGMHGNEPAGVLALQEVLAECEARELPLCGRLVALAGNLAALGTGDRFVDRDLNRMWSREEIAAATRRGDVHEEGPRDQLLALIEAEIADVDEPVVFLDLHSTSAGGSPFTIIGDTPQNRRIAFGLPVPVILGLEENVEGALLGYFGERGHLAIGFEGGQHDTPETVRHHVAAIWITLIRAGGLEISDLREAKRCFDLLREAGRGLPGVIEMRYRHHVEETDGFTMREGFANFDPVELDELLAHDSRGEIRSREHGFVLLPLYQGQGQDGFFIGREVRRLWLRVSTVLRTLRLGRLAHWLPGIRRVPDEIETLEVNSFVARWWVIQIFHLLGFRRVRPVGGHLRFSRRVEGLSERR